jgi:hypothetical protein
MSININFDGDAVQLIRSGFQAAEEKQSARFAQYKRDYAMFSSFIDMTNRDPDRANLFIPKLWSIVKNKVATDVKSLASSRPFFPFIPLRGKEAFKPATDAWVDIIDFLMDKGNYFVHLDLATLIKTVYGTAFMEATPYYETVEVKSLIQTPYGFQKVSEPAERVRFRIWTYAPWEVFVDPAATSLEEQGKCRYVIKVQVVSRRELVRLAKEGKYPKWDWQKSVAGWGTDKYTQWGATLLNMLGLQDIQRDSDISVLLRYESPERYIDCLDGQEILRDIGDSSHPFIKRRMINLSRFIHETDAHTRNSFYGIGEVKPNELLQEMFNTSFDQMFDSWNYASQPVTYYASPGIDRSALVRSLGNKIEVARQDGKPITDYVYESFGRDLPQTHFAVNQKIENMMEMTGETFNNSGTQISASNPTATEISQVNKRSDVRRELNVRRAESMFLKSFGEKAIVVAESSVQPDDMKDIIGEQRAIMAVMANPNDIPSGYNFVFKGSDQVNNQIIKQKNWQDLTPLLLNMDVMPKDELAKILLRVFDEDSPELMDSIDKYAMFQAQLAQAQQQLQQLALENAGREGADKQAGKTGKRNHPLLTDQKVAQEENAAHRGA